MGEAANKEIVCLLAPQRACCLGVFLFVSRKPGKKCFLGRVTGPLFGALPSALRVFLQLLVLRVSADAEISVHRERKAVGWLTGN